MIDPMISLASSVYSSKGVFALLLGSGVSRSSGIPTGWEVTLDLIRRYAELSGEGEACSANPTTWFRAKFGKEPDYSDLVGELGQSSGDRYHLLRPYFEPTELEREENKKVPTTAHKAIASLVVAGYIRVIVTTNFDHLLENALRAAGVTPNVISSADQAKGALPLVHSACTIIKVHGDYTDPRIKNTVAELERYEPEIDRLLDQVIDEYGLIVSGWSADWDVALCHAVERCPTRRFATYWSAFTRLSSKAQMLAEHRQAIVIAGLGADEFFQRLAENVEALADLGQAQPIAIPIAISTLKRFLAEEKHRIRLEDLISDALSEAEEDLTKIRFAPGTHAFSKETLKQFDLYDKSLRKLSTLLMNGARFGQPHQDYIWFDAIERIIRWQQKLLRSGVEVAMFYPAILLFYNVGIGILLSKKDDSFVGLITSGDVPAMSAGENVPISNMNRIFTTQINHRIEQHLKVNPEDSRKVFPLSERLCRYTAEIMKDICPNPDTRLYNFYRFEYLIGLIFCDETRGESEDISSSAWSPTGLFGYQSEIQRQIKAEISLEGSEWPLIKAGLFRGLASRALKSIEVLNALAFLYNRRPLRL